MKLKDVKPGEEVFVTTCSRLAPPEASALVGHCCKVLSIYGHVVVLEAPDKSGEWGFLASDLEELRYPKEW